MLFVYPLDFARTRLAADVGSKGHGNSMDSSTAVQQLRKRTVSRDFIRDLVSLSVESLSTAEPSLVFTILPRAGHLKTLAMLRLCSLGSSPRL